MQMSRNLQNFVKFQKFQFENLVDFEKCCQTHIYLQNFVLIQPRTSPPKNCKNFVKKLQNFFNFAVRLRQPGQADQPPRELQLPEPPRPLGERRGGRAGLPAPDHLQPPPGGGPRPEGREALCLF